MVAELESQKQLVEMGYSVSVPVSEERYDLILDTGSKLLKIQVKRGYYRSDTPNHKMACDFRAGRDNKKYDEGDVDAFIVYDPRDELLYWEPFDEAPQSTDRTHENWTVLEKTLIS